MSHDKIWGQSRTDALNHFSWAEVSTGMLPDSFGWGRREQAVLDAMGAQHLPSPRRALRAFTVSH